VRTHWKRVAVATVLVAGVGATSAVAVPPPPDGQFSGESSQNIRRHKVKIVTDSAGQISKFSIGWEAKCKKKGQFWTTGTVVNAGAISLDGDVFSAGGGYKSDDPGGIRGKVKVSLSGSFSDESTASGTWSAKVTVFKKNRHGKYRKIDKCKTGPVDWTASSTG
jgi:hypothetical protein